MTFKAGDWLTIDYHGFVVIIAKYSDTYIVHKPTWLVSSALRLDNSELARRNPKYIGTGKLRWWWRFLPWRDLVCPVSKPPGLWYVCF